MASNHIRRSIIGHHAIVHKDIGGIRGAPNDWFGQVPTMEGFADLGGMVEPLVNYTIALWQMDPEREHHNPTLAIATPKNSPHCRWMGEILYRRLSRVDDFNVIPLELDELNSIEAPLTRAPRPIYDRSVRAQVGWFNTQFKQWESGERAAMPNPVKAGGKLNPRQCLERAAKGQKILAGITAAHTILQILTSTGVYTANAVLGPDRERALATGVFPATHVQYGYAHIYEYPPMEEVPIRITDEPVQVRRLVPPLALPPLSPPPGELPHLPFV